MALKHALLLVFILYAKLQTEGIVNGIQCYRCRYSKDQDLIKEDPNCVKNNLGRYVNNDTIRVDGSYRTCYTDVEYKNGKLISVFRGGSVTPLTSSILDFARDAGRDIDYNTNTLLTYRCDKDRCNDVPNEDTLSEYCNSAPALKGVFMVVVGSLLIFGTNLKKSQLIL